MSTRPESSPAPPPPAHLIALLDVPAAPEAVLPEASGLVGSHLLDDRSLPTLLAHVDEGASHPVTVVVSGGAGALTTLPRWFRDGRLRLRAIQVAVRDLDDLVGGVRRIAAAARQASYDLPDEVPVHVELPAPDASGGVSARSWEAALDEVAAEGLAGSVRLGGGRAGSPAPEGLALTVEGHLDREIAFRATGDCGAVRSVDDGTPSHGLLNLLLATRVSLDGQDPASAIALSDEIELGRRLTEVGAPALERTRRWLTAADWPSPSYDGLMRLAAPQHA